MRQMTDGMLFDLNPVTIIFSYPFCPHPPQDRVSDTKSIFLFYVVEEVMLTRRQKSQMKKQRVALNPGYFLFPREITGVQE
jgi:hypothetical protein